MEPKRAPWRELGEGYAYVALGCSFAAGVVLFMGAGWLLDRWLGTTPLLTVVGAVTGAVLSFISVYFKLQAEREARDKRKGGE